jgi:hypothetical protein
MRTVANPSDDIDTVLELFSSDKGALVGYNICAAPFYVLLTDCVRTLRRLVPVEAALSEVNMLFERVGDHLPSDPGGAFVHGLAIMARQPGDRISTITQLDPNPAGGSIVLYAGWQVEGESYGAPHEGNAPVPMQLLRAVVYDPDIAYSLSRPVGGPPTIH